MPPGKSPEDKTESKPEYPCPRTSLPQELDLATVYRVLIGAHLRVAGGTQPDSNKEEGSDYAILQSNSK